MSKRKIIIIIILALAIAVLLKIIQTGVTIISVLNHTHVQETDTFLGYMLTKNNKPYIVRCEKEVRDESAIYKKYDKQISIIFSLHSNKDGLPTTQEEKTLSTIEQSFINKIIAKKELRLGGYIIGGGREEIFLYTKDVEKLKKIFDELQKEYLSYQLSFKIQEDKNWNYYNAYCIKRQFPSP